MKYSYTMGYVIVLGIILCAGVLNADVSPKSCSGAIILKGTDIPPQGYLLSKDNGIYCLEGTIEFEPEEPGCSAIKISGKNISLILNDKVITQKNMTPSTVGILLDTAEEITIYGGSITGFTSHGLSSASTNAIAIQALTSSANEGSGLYLDKVSGVVLYYVAAENNQENGISFVHCSQVMMQNCIAEQNKSGIDVRIF